MSVLDMQDLIFIVQSDSKKYVNARVDTHTCSKSLLAGAQWRVYSHTPQYKTVVCARLCDNIHTSIHKSTPEGLEVHRRTFIPRFLDTNIHSNNQTSETIAVKLNTRIATSQINTTQVKEAPNVLTSEWSNSKFGQRVGKLETRIENRRCSS